MKLSKYFQLKNILEIQPFQSSFHTLKNSIILFFIFRKYIFNIIWFLFYQNVTDSIPFLFNNQVVYFGIFIALFLTGYELFKRYALEQFIINVLKN
jgi:hypothetical protein